MVCRHRLHRSIRSVAVGIRPHPSHWRLGVLVGWSDGGVGVCVMLVLMVRHEPIYLIQVPSHFLCTRYKIFIG